MNPRYLYGCQGFSCRFALWWPYRTVWTVPATAPIAERPRHRTRTMTQPIDTYLSLACASRTATCVLKYCRSLVGCVLLGTLRSWKRQEVITFEQAAGRRWKPHQSLNLRAKQSVTRAARFCVGAALIVVLLCAGVEPRGPALFTFAHVMHVWLAVQGWRALYYWHPRSLPQYLQLATVTPVLSY